MLTNVLQLLFLIILGMHTGGALLHAMEEKKSNEPVPHRLSIFFDYHDVEKDNKMVALTQAFGICLHQMASHCIVHKTVLVNFINNIISAANALHWKTIEEFKKEAHFYDLAFYTTLDIDLKKDWAIYHVRQTPLFLFVKGKSINCFNAKNLTEITPDKNVSEMKVVKNSLIKAEAYNQNRINQTELFSSLRKEIEDVKISDEEKKFAITHLEKIFTLNGDNKWNISILGHGSVDDDIAGVAAKEFSAITYFLNKLQTNFMILNSCSSGGKNIDYYKFRDYTGTVKESDTKEAKKTVLVPIKISYPFAIAAVGDEITLGGGFSNIDIQKYEDIDGKAKSKIVYQIHPTVDYLGFFQILEQHKMHKVDFHIQQNPALVQIDRGEDEKDWKYYLSKTSKDIIFNYLLKRIGETKDLSIQNMQDEDGYLFSGPNFEFEQGEFKLQELTNFEQKELENTLNATVNDLRSDVEKTIKYRLYRGYPLLKKLFPKIHQTIIKHVSNIVEDQMNAPAIIANEISNEKITSAIIKNLIKPITQPSFKYRRITYKDILSKKTLLNDWFFTKEGVNGIPQLYTPQSGWFQYWQVDPAIQRLRGIEPGSIDIKDKFAVLVEAKDYTQTLKISPKILPKKSDGSSRWVSWLDEKKFPVLSTSERQSYENKKWVNQLDHDFYYPTFVPVNKQTDSYFFEKIEIESYKENNSNKSGLLHFMRDSFFNAQNRFTPKIFFIKKLTGFNDFQICQSSKHSNMSEFPDDELLNLYNVLIASWRIDPDFKKDTTTFYAYFETKKDDEKKSWELGEIIKHKQLFAPKIPENFSETLHQPEEDIQDSFNALSKIIEERKKNDIQDQVTWLNSKYAMETKESKGEQEQKTLSEILKEKYQQFLNPQPPSLGKSGTPPAASAAAASPLETLKTKLSDLKKSVSKLATSLKSVSTKLEELKRKLVLLKSSSGAS